MTEPRTAAGRALLAKARHYVRPEWIAAIEAEAVDEWLRSPEAERRLAEALVKADAAVSDGWPTDKAIARAILAALRGESA